MSPEPTPASTARSTAGATRCVVVDDHPVVRKGLVFLLRELGGLEVVGEAGDLAGARREVERGRPDLLIIDLVLGDATAIDVIREFRDRFPQLRILVISMMDEAVYGPRILQAGAHGYIMKGAPADELLQAIRVVLGGSLYLDNAVASAIVRNGKAGRSGATAIDEALSNRELEVFRLIGQGLASKEIAAALGISNRTVDAHKTHIRTKLNVRSAAELNKLAALWVQNLIH